MYWIIFRVKKGKLKKIHIYALIKKYMQFALIHQKFLRKIIEPCIDSNIIPVHTKTNVDLSDDLYYYCTTCERSEYII